MASAVANAATRSAINGNSFGDNLRAAIPDAIGGALGNAAARGATALAQAVFQSATFDPTRQETGSVNTEAEAAAEIVVSASLPRGWAIDQFWREQRLMRSPAYQDIYSRRQADLLKIIEPSGASVSPADDFLSKTIATSGFESVDASPDGNVLAIFAQSPDATREQLLAHLQANGLLGDEQRGNLDISRTEFAAYNLLAKNEPFKLRQIMPAIRDLAKIDANAAELENILNGEFNRLSGLASEVVDRGIVGTFLDTGIRGVPGVGDFYGTGMDIINGDFDAESFVSDRLISRFGAAGLSRLGKALPNPGHGLPDVSRAPESVDDVMRYTGRRMDVRAKFVDSSSAQATSPGHSFASRREAYRLALDPEVERVTMNTGYNRLLQLEPRTISPNVRPDAAAVYFDGRVARVEVISKTDIESVLRVRNTALDGQLRNNNFQPLPPQIVYPRVR